MDFSSSLADRLDRAARHSRRASKLGRALIAELAAFMDVTHELTAYISTSDLTESTAAVSPRAYLACLALCHTTLLQVSAYTSALSASQDDLTHIGRAVGHASHLRGLAPSQRIAAYAALIQDRELYPGSSQPLEFSETSPSSFGRPPSPASTRATAGSPAPAPDTDIPLAHLRSLRIGGEPGTLY